MSILYRALPSANTDLEHPDKPREEPGGVLGLVVWSAAKHGTLPPVEGTTQLPTHLAAVVGTPTPGTSHQQAILPGTKEGYFTDGTPVTEILLRWSL